MQYIESSVIGIRSAVISLKQRSAPLRFVLFPMVHVGEQQFYRHVGEMAGECDLIVAEGVPSRFFPVQAWKAGLRWDHLVDQVTALDLDGLGVPVQWEQVIHDKPKTARETALERAADTAGRSSCGWRAAMAARSACPASTSPTITTTARITSVPGGSRATWAARVLHDRDVQLVRALGAIHQERRDRAETVAVVWGAAHIPAAVDHLTEHLGYYVDEARWLIVANAPS